MNSHEDIRRYREEQREAMFEFVRYIAQLATPVILLLILWRVW